MLIYLLRKLHVMFFSFSDPSVPTSSTLQSLSFAVLIAWGIDRSSQRRRRTSGRRVSRWRRGDLWGVDFDPWLSSSCNSICLPDGQRRKPIFRERRGRRVAPARPHVTPVCIPYFYIYLIFLLVSPPQCKRRLRLSFLLCRKE